MDKPPGSRNKLAELESMMDSATDRERDAIRRCLHELRNA